MPPQRLSRHPGRHRWLLARRCRLLPSRRKWSRPNPSQADKPTAVVAADHPAPAGKGALVQLAAVRSEADAKSEWDRLSKRMPDLLAQRHPAISKTDHDGQTLWRVRTGGFADITQAKDFCDRVRAKGSGCSVADF